MRQLRGFVVLNKAYVSAVLIAPVVWGGMFFLAPSVLDLTWWTHEPLLYFSLVIARPVVEEVVFRGMIQGWLIELPWGGRSVFSVTYANMITSALFTGLHFLYHPPLMAAMVLIPSLLFGYFRDVYHGRLIPSVFLHCFYNMGYFLLYPPLEG